MRHLSQILYGTAFLSAGKYNRVSSYGVLLRYIPKSFRLADGGGEKLGKARLYWPVEWNGPNSHRRQAR